MPSKTQKVIKSNAKVRARQPERAVAPPPDRRKLWISLALIAAIFLVYWQVLGYQFINYDDDAYILNNPPVHAGLTGSSLAWALTSVNYFYWQPLTWISHMLDVQMYGLQAGGHHFTSVLLHAVNAVLLFFLLSRLTGSVYRSAFVSALFALHPLRVESVAWIAERKDVLSALFWMLTIWLYSRYVEKPSRARYLAMVAAFCGGLMAKPMVVTLPVVLLMLDYWPLRRPEPWRKLIMEKLPLFALSAISAVITIVGQHAMGALAPLDRIPVPLRLGNVVVSYGEYLWKTILPTGLAILYPYPTHLPSASVIASLAVVSGISAIAIIQRARRPWLFTGWFWFLIVLLPTIGLFQAGDQAFADRFTYLPQIGLFLALVWTGAELLSRRVAMAVAALLLPVLAGASWVQTRYWADSITVAQRAIDVTGRNALMENNLAFALAQQGRLEEADIHFGRSLAIEPRDYIAQYNFGKTLVEEGRPSEGLPHFREAVRLKPNYAEAHFALGTVLYGQHDLDEAARELQLALDDNLAPAYAPGAHNNLGVILAQQGRYAEAATNFAEAARLDPNLPDAPVNYARTLAMQNKKAEALDYLRSVIKTRGETPQLRQMLDSLDASGAPTR